MSGAMARARRRLYTIPHIGLTRALVKLSLSLGWLLLVGSGVAAGQTSACQGNPRHDIEHSQQYRHG